MIPGLAQSLHGRVRYVGACYRRFTVRACRVRGYKDKTVVRGGKVRLAQGRELQKGGAGNGHILLSRNGPVRLNDSAAAILELCDGTRTRDGIVARIVRSKDDDLAGDVREFLDAARRRGWIVEV